MGRTNNFDNYLERFRMYFARHQIIPTMDQVTSIIGVASKKSAHTFYQKMLEMEYFVKDGLRYLPTNKLQSIPYYESVQAGFPSPATDDLKQDMRVEEYLVDKPLSTIYVKVSGDSMTDAGIFPGDIVVVDKGAKEKPGDIVVAVVDGDYTVKYLEKNTDGYYLRPGNTAYPNIYPEDSMEIFGVVKGSFRKYH